MLEGLYSAAAGMAAQQQRIDGVSNDLANASRPATSTCASASATCSTAHRAARPARPCSAGAGAAAGFIGRSQGQGALQTTDQPLDVAIQGPGFLQVKRAGRLDRAHPRRLAATRRATAA